jgi:putative cell wall-binding protein
VQSFQFGLSKLAAGSHSYTLTIGSGPSATSQSGFFDTPMTAGVPEIAGTPAVGQVLTAMAPGAASHAALSYQWLDEGAGGSGTTAIAGATAKTFVPTPAQAGHQLAVRVTASELGVADTKTSAATGAVAGVEVTRIAGTDRWATGVAASQKQFPNGATTVFLTSGDNYPDALSAAPAAAKAGGDLLLTAGSSLPSSVRSELVRLRPTHVYIIGGAAAVSQTVANQARDATGVAPVRISGADRYATSASVAAAFFPSAAAVFVATGEGFPDALSAAGAASGLADPVLLVPGTTGTVPAATAAQLSRLSPAKIYAVGGTAVVSESMASALQQTAPVTRLSGADRYDTAVAVGAAFHPGTAPTAVVASGENFPDALVGSVLSGFDQAPLYLSPAACVPGPVVSELSRLKASAVLLMGGTAVLSHAVETLTPCSGPV